VYIRALQATCEKSLLPGPEYLNAEKNIILKIITNKYGGKMGTEYTTGNFYPAKDIFSEYSVFNSLK
jgi:hypothetical protein